VSEGERERLCLKERDIRVLFCLTSPGQKLLRVAIQAGKSVCAGCLLCRSQGPPELEQRGVCSYCPSPEWQLSVGPRAGPGGPGSHIQGWRTVLTETMSLPFKSPIRRCLNVNTCSHSLGPWMETSRIQESKILPNFIRRYLPFSLFGVNVG